MTPQRTIALILLLACVVVSAACSKQTPEAQPQAQPQAEQPKSDEGPPSEIMAIVNKPWTGDFDQMTQRRVIRALVVYNKTNYFLDGAEQKGATYDGLKAFEEEINKKLNTGHLKVHVAFIPVTRDQLIPGLLQGRGDIAASNLTITPERSQLVDFGEALLSNVSEIVVTGPTAQPLTSMDDLGGQQIYVREGSSAYESLVRLNKSLETSGKPQIQIEKIDQRLESEDILEMVNAGLIPMTVVDNHMAQFWTQVFDGIKARADLAVHTGGQIAWAFRKDSPNLRQAVNDFVREHKEGTLFGNMVLKKYLRDTKYVLNATSEEEMKKFQSTIAFFKKYAARYDFDWLMVAAQSYQESKIDQSVKSQVGAIGVMQVLPSTAADPSVGIPDISTVENNVHAGVKYMRFMMNHYFKDAKMDRLNKGLFALASYNAGPAKVASMRKEAEEMGLDPNLWFNNVEVVAAKRIGRETVQYVSNIYKYFIAYKLISEQREKKKQIKSQKS
jgi:membrane-bound lytic murein transglycosylase MltF